MATPSSDPNPNDSFAPNDPLHPEVSASLDSLASDGAPDRPPSRAGFVPLDVAPPSDAADVPTAEAVTRAVALPDVSGAPLSPTAPIAPADNKSNPFDGSVFDLGKEEQESAGRADSDRRLDLLDSGNLGNSGKPGSSGHGVSDRAGIKAAPDITPSPEPSPEPYQSVRPDVIATPPDTEPKAGRATRWKRLKSWRSGHLRRRELIATIGLFSSTSVLLHWLMRRSNDLLLNLGLRPIQTFYVEHNVELALFFGVTAIAAPFLLDVLLDRRYQAQPLTQRSLAKHSPEAAQLLTRFAQPKQRSKPQLYTLDSPAAFVWAYGYGATSLRLVISSGAITMLSAEELAVDVAAALASGVQRDVWFATASVALLQLPYALYDGLTHIGDRCLTWTQQARPKTLGVDRASVRIVAAETGLWLTATIASVAYGFFRLLRLPLLAWSRLRHTYADQFAANLTGNPNARARSLVKQALSQRQAFDRDRALPELSERFELLGTVNPRHGIWCAAHAQPPTIARLTWDAITPYGTWLAIGDAHPALGQRLARLTRLAQQFEIEAEFPADCFDRPADAPRRPHTPQRTLPITPASLLESAALMHNAAPLIGIVVALALVALVASIGMIGDWFNLQSLAWLQADWPWIALGLVLEGFAIGTVLRINAFFPNFKPYALNAEPDLDRWLSDPDSLPIDSRTLRLSGTLVGRGTVANWFGQDLWLDDGATLWPLHYLDRTGWLGGLLPTHDRLYPHIGQRVTITGWFRRGLTPWIDVDRLELGDSTDCPATDNQPQNGHPLWSTAIASLCAVWGAVLLARGGL